MKNNILSIIILFVAFNTNAQNEPNIWYFGDKAGIDFNSGSPVALINSAMVQTEGTAVANDKTTGSLLFYTNGVNVWNRNHIVMPNGSGLLGDNTSTQSALIVPNPANSNQYYLFTVAPYGGAIGLRYSIIDMTLVGGFGNVVTGSKNILLLTSVSEKLTAIPYASGNAYWIIVHKWGTNQFYSYLLSSTGFSAPVISSVGAVHNFSGGSEANADAIGYLKPSPNGTKLASAIYNGSTAREAELFDFDASSGIVSNPITLMLQQGNYGVSFSPDNSKVYISSLTFPIFQFDLNAGSPANIIASKTMTGSFGGAALQLTPNGKIYISQVNQTFVSAINNPNALGLACNPQYMAFNIAGKQGKLGLPNFMQSTFNCNDCPAGIDDIDLNFLTSIYPNPAKETVHIEFENKNREKISLRIVNALGAIIYETSFSNDIQLKEEINISNFAGGIYYIELTVGNKQVHKKLIKSTN